MTIPFIAAGAALILATLVLLLRPFWLRRPASVDSVSQRGINIAIYRDQLAELENDRAAGALDKTDYEAARQEIQRRLLEDGTADEALPSAATHSRKAVIALSLILPLVAGFLYAFLGNPAALNPPPQERRLTAGDIERMVAKLAQRLEKEPDNPQGWVMLGRSYKALGRHDEAVKAYGRGIKLVETDAQLLADYADVLIASSRSFAGKPQEMIDKALKLDPDNLQALWLSGTAAFEQGGYAKAIAAWERLVKLLPPDSEDAQSLAGSIAQAREAAAKSAPEKRRKR